MRRSGHGQVQPRGTYADDRYTVGGTRSERMHHSGPRTRWAVKRNSITGAVATEGYGQGFYHRIMRSWTSYDLREIQLPVQGAADIVDVLTSDQLRVEVDASFRFRIDPAASTRYLPGNWQPPWL